MFLRIDQNEIKVTSGSVTSDIVVLSFTHLSSLLLSVFSRI